MYYQIRTTIFILCCLLSLSLKGQVNIPVGSWRTHFSFTNILSVTGNENYAYATSGNGLFRVDIQNGQNKIISKIEGLNDSRIGLLAYSESTNIIIIAYASGNIDLIKNDEDIINIDDVLISNAIIGSKSVNHIFVYENFAFISYNFGLVKLDLERLEISEDYRNLSLSTDQIEIFGSTISGDSIYLSTEQGIMQAAFSDDVNLQDVNNWRLFGINDSLPNSGFGPIISIDEHVFAVQKTDTNNTLYDYANGQWSKKLASNSIPIKQLKKQEDKMIFIYGGDIQIWDNSTAPFLTANNPSIFPSPSDAFLDQFGHFWVATNDRGLVSDYKDGWEIVSPNGPFSNNAERLLFFKGQLAVTTGGRLPNYTQLGRAEGYAIFEEGEWTSYLPFESPAGENLGAFVLDLYEPYYYDQLDALAIGSIGYGLIMDFPGDSLLIFTENNSTLQNLLPGFPSTRVAAMTQNLNKDLIVSNVQAPNPLLAFNVETGWRQIILSNPTGTRLDRIDEMTVDENNNIWCRNNFQQGGMVVFNEEENRVISLGINPREGNLPNNVVNTMTKDLEGDIWVGTNDGVAVFFNPSRIFENNAIDANTPIFENRPLLREQSITAIAVDAANRKWIGTTTGLWLFEADGTRVVANFTEDNSPLLSNNIKDIEIMDNTGEVFIATENGIISFRGSAIASSTVCDEIEVFPNPVLPNFQGQVLINNVPLNANVKIADISGKLFHEATASGNSVAWNVRDYTGARPKTGVYVIYTTTDDGEESCISKIAIVE